MLIFGTRPEAIKMIPLVKELCNYPSEFQVCVCVTGQHREMLHQVLSLFGIIPDYDLKIMKDGQDLYDITSVILLRLRDIFKENRPDIVLVHGDTTTSVSAALAAFYQQIPVGHIEAGLRTYNIYSPWPEEINRQIISRIATFNFAPTNLSKKNLLNEGVPDSHIFVTGNTVIDALHYIMERISQEDDLKERLNSELKKFGYDMSRLSSNNKMILITGHRRENFGKGLYHVCVAIKELANKYPSVDFVYPMHLNPQVRQPIHQIFDNHQNSNVFFIEPLEYLHFVYVMSRCYLVLTDSGGIQEEAPGLGKPVLVMRDTTERPEAVEAGTVKLIGTDSNKLMGAVSQLLDDEETYQTMSKATNPYGDGKAVQRITSYLLMNDNYDKF